MTRALYCRVLVLCAALAGCATPPPDRFYTLNGGAHAAPDAAGVPVSGAAPLYIEMLAVSVPEQVSRNQLVVTSAAGRIELLEQERWVGPLAGEIGRALSTAVSNRLGAIDVYHTPYPEKASVYRISTSVQRFESVLGQYALIDAVWSVRQLTSGKVLTCRTVANEPVSGGYDALVAGHRRAVARLADAMSKTVRALVAGGPGGC
ncbi:MAG: PqiC family protein [Pseudomonadota bacterium]